MPINVGRSALTMNHKGQERKMCWAWPAVDHTWVRDGQPQWVVPRDAWCV